MNRRNYLEDPMNEAAMADRIRDIIMQGDAARPSADVVSQLRRSFAPATIATKYLEALFGS